MGRSDLSQDGVHRYTLGGLHVCSIICLAFSMFASGENIPLAQTSPTVQRIGVLSVSSCPKEDQCWSSINGADRTLLICTNAVALFGAVLSLHSTIVTNSIVAKSCSVWTAHILSCVGSISLLTAFIVLLNSVGFHNIKPGSTFLIAGIVSEAAGLVALGVMSCRKSRPNKDKPSPADEACTRRGWDLQIFGRSYDVEVVGRRLSVTQRLPATPPRPPSPTLTAVYGKNESRLTIGQLVPPKTRFGKPKKELPPLPIHRGQVLRDQPPSPTGTQSIMLQRPQEAVIAPAHFNEFSVGQPLKRFRAKPITAEPSTSMPPPYSQETSPIEVREPSPSVPASSPDPTRSVKVRDFAQDGPNRRPEVATRGPRLPRQTVMSSTQNIPYSRLSAFGGRASIQPRGEPLPGTVTADKTQDQRPAVSRFIEELPAERTARIGSIVAPRRGSSQRPVSLSDSTSSDEPADRDRSSSEEYEEVAGQANGAGALDEVLAALRVSTSNVTTDGEPPPTKAHRRAPSSEARTGLATSSRGQQRPSSSVTNQSNQSASPSNNMRQVHNLPRGGKKDAPDRFATL